MLVDAARCVNDLNPMPWPYRDAEFTQDLYKSPKSPPLDYAVKLWGLLLHRKKVNGFFLSPTVCIGKMERTVR